MSPDYLHCVKQAFLRYCGEQLKGSTKELSRCILYLSLHAGRVVSLFPRDIELQDMTDFYRGGMSSLVDRHPEIFEFIIHFLFESFGNCLILENSLALPSDPFRVVETMTLVTSGPAWQHRR
jgi:hypothetical protein